MELNEIPYIIKICPVCYNILVLTLFIVQWESIFLDETRIINFQGKNKYNNIMISAHQSLYIYTFVCIIMGSVLNLHALEMDKWQVTMMTAVVSIPMTVVKQWMIISRQGAGYTSSMNYTVACIVHHSWDQQRNLLDRMLCCRLIPETWYCVREEAYTI